MGTRGRRPFAALRVWTLPLGLGAMLLGVAQTWAASPTDELRNAFADVYRILGDPEMEAKPEERLVAIRRIVSRLVDVREVAQTALGPEWHARTAREQQEFVQLFGALLERAYVSRVASGTMLEGESSVAYLGQAVEGSRAIVYTVMPSRVGGATAFEYRMLKRGDRWTVHDVVVDGVSLVSNYQAQFARVIQASSYDELVELMRVKASPGGGAPAPVASAPAAGESISFTETRSVITETPAPPVPGGALTAATTPIAEPPTGTPARAEATPAAQIAPSADAAPPAEGPRPTVEIAKVDVATAVSSAPAASVAAAAAPEAAGETRLSATGPAPAAVATGTRSYWVQVGAFRSGELARQLTERLRRENFPATQQRGEGLTRVRVGPLPARAQAISTLRELEAKGYQPFLAEVGR